MSKPKKSYGKCFYCGKTYTQRGMSRHLQACPARKEANAQEKGKEFRLLHFKLWGNYAPDFWMNIEMAAKDTLADMDQFIRDIWVECCGHLSQFIINGIYYSATPMSSYGFGSASREGSIDTPLWNVARPGDEFDYEYDFGTTTNIKIRVIEERYGSIPKDSVQVMARNYSPKAQCTECDRQAAYVYVWGGYPYTPYCKKHAEEQDYDLEGFLPIVNSPRFGQCGYTGPDDEKYIFDETYTSEK